MENNLINKTKYMEQTKSSRPLLSTGAAIALGLSAIIITVIIVAGVVVLRGVDIVETLESLDINVTGEVSEEQGEMQVNVEINQPISSGEINWNNMSFLNVVSLAKNAGLDGEVMLDQPITISETLDLNGDRLTDAVFSGIGGNAGVSFILLNSNGQPTVAQQQSRLGFVGPVALYQVGRVGTSMGYELLPEENGYYILEKRLDQTTESLACYSLDVLVWNESTEIFEYNQVLSDQYYTQECS